MQQILIQQEAWPDLGFVSYKIMFPLQKKVQEVSIRPLPKSAAIHARDAALNKLINTTLRRFVNQRRIALKNSGMVWTNNLSFNEIESAIRLAEMNGLAQWKKQIGKVKYALLYLCPQNTSSRFYKWNMIINNIINILS